MDGPVWHARLRLAATDVIDAARSFGLDVTELVVKNTTTSSPMHPNDAAATTPPMKPLSAAAREALRVALDTDGSEPLSEIDS